MECKFRLDRGILQCTKHSVYPSLCVMSQKLARPPYHSFWYSIYDSDREVRHTVHIKLSISFITDVSITTHSTYFCWDVAQWHWQLKRLACVRHRI